MIRTTVLLLMGSAVWFAKLLGQLDSGLWEKSAWVIMTFCFASALVSVWARGNKKQDDLITAKDDVIASKDAALAAKEAELAAKDELLRAYREIAQLRGETVEGL